MKGETLEIVFQNVQLLKEDNKFLVQIQTRIRIQSKEVQSHKKRSILGAKIYFLNFFNFFWDQTKGNLQCQILETLYFF